MRKALQPLGKIEIGLAKRAADFVCTGEGEAVLLTLQQKAAKVAPALGLRDWWQYRGKTWALSPILDSEDYWDPAVILRLGRLYATTEALLNTTYGFCGTKAAPMWLRLLLTVTEKAISRSRMYEDEAGRRFGQFPAARCRELLRLAEEPDDGLLDILFHRSSKRRASSSLLSWASASTALGSPRSGRR